MRIWAAIRRHQGDAFRQKTGRKFTYAIEGNVVGDKFGWAASVVGDLNGDGILDMVAAFRDENRVGVYLGVGDGTFSATRSPTLT